LPTKGWVFVDQRQVGNSVTLGYTKGSEQLSVEIDQNTWRTRVVVEIHPTGVAAAR